MKVVVDISKEDYNNIEPFLNGQKIKGGFNLFKALEIIKNGTSLPEHHGRLKDVDAFITKVKADRKHSIYLRSWTADDVLNALDNSYAPTIIEADKESEE